MCVSYNRREISQFHVSKKLGIMETQKMKIEIVKKTNKILLVVLVIFVLGLIGVSTLSDWSNMRFDEGHQLSDANNTDLEEQVVLAGKASKVSLNEEQLPNQLAENEDAGANVDIEGQEVKEEKVSTEGDKKGEFIFVAIGDSENYKSSTGYNEKLPLILEKAKEQKPDFALFTGDIITTGANNLNENRSRIEGSKNLIEKYFNNYYIAFGKHDIECGWNCIELWFEIFFDQKLGATEKPDLFHSFDYLNTHFVLLSSDYPLKHSIDEEQLKWLEEDLDKTLKVNKIVVQHVPPVSFFKKSVKECHDMSCSGEVPEKLLKIFKENKVDLVISGHEHVFDHKIESDIDFVLSGNSGNSTRHKEAIKGNIFSIFKIADEKISVTAINTSGKVIREISIK